MSEFQKFCRRHPWKFSILSIAVTLTLFFAIRLSVAVAQTEANAATEPDSYLVLGGSVAREVMAAYYSRKHPERYIVLSTKTTPACLIKIYRRYHGSVAKSVVEDHASSTFENFYYGAQVLKSLGLRNVIVITAREHKPRAELLGKIFLTSHGIAMSFAVTPPDVHDGGHDESPLKTVLDTGRTILWALLTQFYLPKCSFYEMRTLPAEELERTQCRCQPIPRNIEKYVWN